MRLYRPHEETDALAYAAAGGQALHFIGITPARLYDRNLRRLVETVRSLGRPDVHVARTCTTRQHVVLQGLPLLKAGLHAERVDNASVADIVAGCRRQEVARA